MHAVRIAGYGELRLGIQMRHISDKESRYMSPENIHSSRNLYEVSSMQPNIDYVNVILETGSIFLDNLQGSFLVYHFIYIVCEGRGAGSAIR